MPDGKITPVIISGGSGSRLWPLSRKHRPKQFLPLKDEHSLFELTLDRVQNNALFAPPIVVANDDHRFLALELMQIAGLSKFDLLLEPEGRNTAAAITLAALSAKPDDTLLILPSDHIIENMEAFHKALHAGMAEASAGQIVTFGMTPTHPATGFGYIQHGEKSKIDGAFKALEFVEKPDTDTAKHYIASGKYSWNAGIFMFKAQVLLDAMADHAPDILDSTKNAFSSRQSDLSFTRFDEALFSNIRSESIDYAIMEKAQNISVVPAEMGWSDVGSFSALAELTSKDERGNRIEASETILQDCDDVYIRSDDRLVAALGLKNITIINMDDALLVADSSRDQDVKKIVETLKQDGRHELDFHSTVFRPWGTFKPIGQGDNYQVKRIVVYPGKRLSLQKHYHRAEHWIIVSGTAIVTRDEEKFQLSENQSVYIPLGAVHRLENPGKIPLVLIEIQSGSYLGEDDIVRLEDDFAREAEPGSK